jgi:hypothetical protein
VWGTRGAAPLLDWLGVQRRYRFARASVLDSGESDLDGLVLLDLPDHDSVVTASQASVDRLATLADMVVWVLDPQKYADAAVHDRYLVPLAGHAEVFTVVLNQIDSLTPQQAVECLEDLRNLLDREGLENVPVIPVSAHTGAGLADLRLLLTDAVAQGRAAADRITADIDAVIERFVAYSGPQVSPDAVLDSEPLAADAEPQRPSLPPWELAEEDEQEPEPSRPPWEDAAKVGGAEDAADQGDSVPDEPGVRLTGAFAKASGLTAVAQAMAGTRKAQAAQRTGWPAGRLLRGHRELLRADTAVGQAQQSEVDNALTAFADAVGGGMPEPWASGLRDAARVNARTVPGALADAVLTAADESQQGPPGWWQLVAVWQWLLTVLAVAGIAGCVAIGVARAAGHTQGLLGETSLIPLLAVMAVAMLVLGYVTAASCRNAAAAAVDRERVIVELAMRDRVAAVTHDLVLRPTGSQIAQYERFRRELRVAAAGRQGV